MLVVYVNNPICHYSYQVFLLQIPVCLVCPTGLKPTAKDRDVPACRITIPNKLDNGILPNDFGIVIVHNNIDHYVSTKRKQKTFKDGVDDLMFDMNKVYISTCKELLNSTCDPNVKQLFNTILSETKETVFKVAQLFTVVPSQDSSITVDPKPRTRQIPSKVSKTTCPCGVEKHTDEELISHIQRRHNAPDTWYCSMCPKSCATKKAQKLHLRNQHFNEFLH